MTIIKHSSHISFPVTIVGLTSSATASKLAVYAGVACRNGKRLTLRTWRYHDDIKRSAYTGKASEYKHVGWNTKLSAQLGLTAEGFIKMNPGRSWFRNYYNRQKDRLWKRAKRDGTAIQADGLMAEKSIERGDKNPMRLGEWYIVGRKKHSLKSWAHEGASVRMQRVLLHLIWSEWRMYRGLEVRVPYPEEFMGKKRGMNRITLEEILAGDRDWETNVITPSASSH